MALRSSPTENNPEDQIPAEEQKKPRVRPARPPALGPDFDPARLIDRMSARQAHALYQSLKELFGKDS